MPKVFVLIFLFIISLITAGADVFLKRAALKAGLSGWKEMVLGALIYGLTALGWVYIFKRMEMSNAGAIYSLSIIVFLVFVGVVYFKENYFSSSPARLFILCYT